MHSRQLSEEQHAQKLIEEDAKVEQLRQQMEALRLGVPNALAAYVQAALEFGVAQTRKEYRGYANRNWRTIQRFGTRFLRGMFITGLVLIALGYVGYKTTTDIQTSRRERIRDACIRGQHFVVKLHSEINRQPEPKKREGLAQEKETIELVETITGPIPITRDKLGNYIPGDCAHVVAGAGL